MSQYDQLGIITSSLFPSFTFRPAKQLYEAFILCKEQLELLNLVRSWLIQQARIQVKNLTTEPNVDSGYLDELETAVDQYRTIFSGLDPLHLDMMKFFLPKSNTLFEEIVKEKLEEHLEMDLEQFSMVLSEVYSTMENLITGISLFSKVKHLLQAVTIKKIKTPIVQEVQQYFSLCGKNYEAVSHYLQDGLILVQYLDHIPAVTNCCNQFSICCASADNLGGMVHNLDHQSKDTSQQMLGCAEGTTRRDFRLDT